MKPIILLAIILSACAPAASAPAGTSESPCLAAIRERDITGQTYVSMGCTGVLPDASPMPATCDTVRAAFAAAQEQSARICTGQ